MPAERKPARDHWFVRRGPGASPPEEHRDAACRHRDIYEPADVTPGVSTGRDYVSAQQHGEQATEDDVRCLEVAVAAPDAPARSCDGGNREYQKNDKSRDSGQLVEWRRGLQILHDHVVRHHRQKYMEHRRAEGYPTEQFMAAEREQNRRVGFPRSDGAAA